MKPKLILLFLMGYCCTLFAQNLEKMLWDNVKKCNEQIAAEGEDFYSKKAVHPRNGYLSVAGGWPTCGCGCEATVAAFKDVQSKYTFVRYEDWNCAQEFGIYTSKNVHDVMPKDFTIGSFSRSGVANFPTDKSYFYIEIELPLHGTEVAVELKPLPLGMVGKGKNGLSYNTESVEIIDQAAANLTEVAQILSSVEELDYLRKGKLELLPKATQKKIQAILRSYNRSFESFGKTLQEAYQAYQIYQQLAFTTAVFGWDRTEARLFIKSKSIPPEKMNFLVFLRSTRTYLSIC